MSDQGQDWLAPVTGVTSAAITGLLIWLGQRLVGKAAFQTALNEGFMKLATELRQELKDEREKTREQAKRIQNLEQHIGSMERLLFLKGMFPDREAKPIEIEARLSEITHLGKEVGDAGD